MTASSFAAVSVDPQLVLFSIAGTARAHGFLQHADRFGVNLLQESLEIISSLRHLLRASRNFQQ